MNTKDPLSDIEIRDSDEHLNELDKKGFDYQVCKLMRYTGMHSICTYHPKSNIRIEKRTDDHYVVWYRPKKGAIKGKGGLWAEVRGVPLHAELDFDIVDFYKRNVRRNKTMDAKRRRVSRAVQKTYKKIAPGTTPNTLRHTFAMVLLNDHHIPEKDVAEMIGTTVKTLRDYYNRMGEKKSSNQMRVTGWRKPRAGNPNL